MSHPAWVCGLKLYNRFHECSAFWVTPCVGVWIETVMDKGTVITEKVTPCVGVWIETIMHPRQTGQGIVTPCVGVWIETYSEHIANVQKGHTLRGCVD